ncbi:hypothetical protein GCM10011510_11980 [Streptococcus himalayensis]|uniref:Uncharacterized protein n=2 Tax=Streptococcus himalayensis TaxID=1888195 RepID=A0A917A7M8_9STRE|nr:hypothetical protein GCM10011510_11980 [Streptococcus himalayensis]
MIFSTPLVYCYQKTELEAIVMSQPIVPLETPQSRRFDKKNKNEMVLKMRIGRVELSLFQSLHQETLETILDKVLAYEHSTQ